LEPPAKKNRKDLPVGFDLLQSLKNVESDQEEDDSGSEDSCDELDNFNKARLKVFLFLLVLGERLGFVFTPFPSSFFHNSWQTR